MGMLLIKISNLNPSLDQKRITRVSNAREMEETKPSLQQLQNHHQQNLSQSLLDQHLQQNQQAISRFPANIDAHLVPPGLRNSLIPNLGSSDALLQQQQVVGSIRAQGQPAGNNPEMQMVYQDLWRVCHPDVNRPFASLEDACERLLPYHVLADYEAEENDRILDSDPTGQVFSRSQQWDNNIASKVAEFTDTFEKQVLGFNIMSHKRSLGEFRSEERLMLERALLQEEKMSLLQLKTEIKSREKASCEAQFRMVQMEQSHGVPQPTRGPLQGSAIGSQGSDHEMSERGNGVNNNNPDEMMMNGWGSSVQRDERGTSEYFLNDEETANGETSGQQKWWDMGEFDLNSR